MLKKCSQLFLISLMLGTAQGAWAAPYPKGYQELQQDYHLQARIEKFYQAFQRKDAAGMAACYHPEVEFYDPIFETLRGKRAKAMWAMLVDAGGEQLTLSYKNISVENGQGQAFWEAKYPFSVTGFRVHNKIQARFEFKDGLIYRHHDDFDLYRWSSMAMGPIGALLGGTPLFKDTLKAQAHKRLADYIQVHPEFQ